MLGLATKAALNDLEGRLSILELRVTQLEQERASRELDWERQQLEMTRLLNRLRTQLQRQTQREQADQGPSLGDLKLRGRHGPV